MVSNSEKKTTRKIRKNRQTRRKRVLKMKTKMRKNRMHKTMKGGAVISLTTLREQLKSTGDLGKQINLHLNENAKYIAEKRKAGDDFIKSYNYALKPTNPTSTSTPKQTWMPVAPAAGSVQMIQFIPDTDRDIPDSIQDLITKIMAYYRDLCSAFRPNNSCGNRHPLYKLTPDEFDRVLRDVCSGEVHTPLCVGEICRKFIPRRKDKYVNLKNSLSNIVKKPNPSPDNFNTTFGPITSSSEGRKLDFTIILNKDNQDSVFESVFQIYVELYNFLKETLLNPNSINCKACIIVMPPFEKTSAPQGHGQLMSPVTYGYSSFTNPRLFEWVALKQGERLEPNSYCAVRTNTRAMANGSTLSTLNYTISPLVIPNGLLPLPSLQYDIQSQHNSLLQTMKDMLVMNLNPRDPTDELIEKKAKLQSDFGTNGKVEMTHIFDQNKIYYYYELKIQKTTIPVKSTVISDTNINAVIIEFKVFSEDGICSKEIIFVSYERPSQDNAIGFLPGAISDDTNTLQVSPETMNSTIHELFVNKFLELDRSLYQVAPDKTVLNLKGNDGNLASRGSQSITQPTKSQPLQLRVAASEDSDGICTIILEKNDSKFSWSIANATDIQKGAFTAVNKHITTTTGWTLERGQTIFTVDNQKTDEEEIKVTVRVLTVDKAPSNKNKLLSATYQAQDSVPYLLFADRAVAEQYLQSKMMI